MQNTHSIITDQGTLSMVRTAENLAHDIRRGFEKRDQRVTMMKKIEASRRKKILRESVRIIQQTNKASRSEFAAELSQYEPPLAPVTESNDLTTEDVPQLLDVMSREESETLKSIVGQFREGMSIKKLLAIAKVAKDSSEEKDARRIRTDRLMQALSISSNQNGDAAFSDMVHSVLDAKDWLPLPPDPRHPEAYSSSSSYSSSDSDNDLHDHDDSGCVSDVDDSVVFDYLKPLHHSAAKKCHDDRKKSSSSKPL